MLASDGDGWLAVPRHQNPRATAFKTKNEAIEYLVK